MATKHINMIKGDTLSFGLEIEDLNGDLSSAYFTCRASYDTAILFQKSLGSGITKVSSGVYRVRVAPEDTESLAVGRYVYDFQIGANNDVFTIMSGILEIDAGVT